MFQELINRLTQEQKQELITRGIPQPRLSDWKRGKRLPTRTQVLILADVTETDAMEIEREVMALEIKPEERAIFSRVLGTRTAALGVAILSLGMLGTPSNANAHGGLQPIRHAVTIYTSWKVCLIRLGELLALFRRLKAPIPC